MKRVEERSGKIPAVVNYLEGDYVVDAKIKDLRRFELLKSANSSTGLETRFSDENRFRQISGSTDYLDGGETGKIVLY